MKVTIGESQTIFELEACPLCGGKSGFTYRVTTRGIQTRSWRGGDSYGYFEDISSTHGAYRCDDCGKIVKTPRFSRIDEQNSPHP